MEYRRARTAGGCYFFTVVTHERRRFLCDPEAIALLRTVTKKVMVLHPFTIDAMVVMPDHLHAIWTLPPDDDDYAIRWSLIKGGFSRACPANYKGILNPSRRKRKEQAVWQQRYWEHEIRSDEDFSRHVEYIHYNPVKHGLAVAPSDWPSSSFHRYVRDGRYSADWGRGGEMIFAGLVGQE